MPQLLRHPTLLVRTAGSGETIWTAGFEDRRVQQRERSSAKEKSVNLEIHSGFLNYPHLIPDYSRGHRQ